MVDDFYPNTATVYPFNDDLEAIEIKCDIQPSTSGTSVEDSAGGIRLHQGFTIYSPRFDGDTQLGKGSSISFNGLRKLITSVFTFSDLLPHVEIKCLN